MAKLTSIAVVVRPMTDRQVRIAQDQENARRADVSPVERARAYRGLRESGLTLAEIAEQVGISEAQVREYLLLVRMPDVLAEAVAAGRVTPSDAATVCRIPDTAQRELAAWCVVLGRSNPGYVASLTDKNRAGLIAVGDHRAMDRREIRSLIDQHFQRSLKGCGFPTKGRQSLELVPDRPACDACTDRAGNRAKLDDAYAGVRAATCLDVTCFAAKQAAWRDQEAARLAEVGARVVPAGEDVEYLAGSGLAYKFKDLEKDEPYVSGFVPSDFQKELAKARESLLPKAVWVWVPEKSAYRPVVTEQQFANAIRKEMTAGVPTKGKSADKKPKVPTHADILQECERRAVKAAVSRIQGGRLPKGEPFDRIVARTMLHLVEDASIDLASLATVTGGAADVDEWIQSPDTTFDQVRNLTAALAAILLVQTTGCGRYGMAAFTADVFESLTSRKFDVLRNDVTEDLTAKPAPARKGSAA